MLNPCGLAGVRWYIGKNWVELFVSCAGGCSLLTFFSKFHLASVFGEGSAVCLPIGEYLSRHCHYIGADEWWSLSPATGSPVCNNVWPTPLWRRSYSIHIHMFGSTVAANFRWGGWPGVSDYPPTMCLSGRPLRQWMGEINNVVGIRHPNHCVFCSAVRRLFSGVFWT